jgi:Tol biopolymer transport system component
MQRISSDLSKRGDPVRLTTGLNAHTISLDGSGTSLAYSVFTTVANIWSTPIPSSPVESPPLKEVTTGNQTIESGYVSPDGQWLAYDSNLNGNQDIYKMPIGGGEPQQLTHNGADNFQPQWSSDGRQIAFHTLLKGNRDIYVVDASGGNPVPVAATPSEELTPIWQPDGQRILFFTFPDSIFEVRRAGSGWGKSRFLYRGSWAVFSPDGKQLAVDAPAGSLCGDCPAGLYLMNPDGTGRRPIPTKLIGEMKGRGYTPWSRDSRHLYLSVRQNDGTSSIWQLPVNGDREVRLVHLTDPRQQFFRWNIDADSKNFYFTLGDRQSDIWTMELKKKQ